MFQRLILGDTFTAGTAIGVGIVSAELLQRVAFRADVLVVLWVPFEVDERTCTVCPSGFVEHRNVGIDFAINEPPKHRP